MSPNTYLLSKSKNWSSSLLYIMDLKHVAKQWEGCFGPWNVNQILTQSHWHLFYLILVWCNMRLLIVNWNYG